MMVVVLVVGGVSPKREVQSVSSKWVSGVLFNFSNCIWISVDFGYESYGEL